MAKVCGNCGKLNDDELIRCENCDAIFSKSSPTPITVQGIENALYPRVRKRFIRDIVVAGSTVLGIGALALVLGSIHVYNTTIDYADTNLARQVAVQFNDEHVKQTLSTVASNEASLLLRKEINPAVNQFRLDVSNQVQQFQGFLGGMQGSLTNTENRITLAESRISATSNQIFALDAQVVSVRASSRDLLTQLTQSSQEIEVLRLYLDAKQGSMAAYRALGQYSETNGSHRAVALANAALDELWLSVEDLRAHGIMWFFSTETADGFIQFRPPAEQVYRRLVHGNINDRVGALNNIRDRHLKYFTAILADIVASNENWRVTALAVSVLEGFAGKHFEVHPPYPLVAKWWQTEGVTNADYRNPMDSNGVIDLPAGGTNNPMETLGRVVETNPGLCDTRFQLAMYWQGAQRRDKAEAQLKAIQEECDAQIGPGIFLAQMLIEDGKLDEVTTLLHNLRKWWFPRDTFDALLRDNPTYRVLTNRFDEILKD